ncbi:hypothetical protein HKD37_15G041805 [Glycine soja]
MHGDAQRRTPIQSFSSTVTTMTHTQEKVETDLVNVWTPQELCKACRNYVNFVSVCYLVPGIGLQRLENDRDVLYMCQIGLADPEKEVHVNLENSDLEGGPNGIEDMDVDGAKGGSDDENEVLGTGVQDAEIEVVETIVETELKREQ